MKNVLFSATLREIRYLLEMGYLNEEGIKWASSFEIEELEDA